MQHAMYIHATEAIVVVVYMQVRNGLSTFIEEKGSTGCHKQILNELPNCKIVAISYSCYWLFNRSIIIKNYVLLRVSLVKHVAF